jgi:hypothetical protein
LGRAIGERILSIEGLASLHGGTMTDRLYELSNQLAALIEQMRSESERRDASDLQAPLDWLEEANRWLNYNLAQMSGQLPRDAVPFTYIPVELRK